MAAKIRRIDDDELRIGNPHLIFSIFVAARFYLGMHIRFWIASKPSLTLSTVYAKALDADVPSNLRSLLHALHMCGQRWTLARRYEKVILTAVAEHGTSVLIS